MQLEEPDEKQRLEWELGPKGRRLAGSYLKGQGAPFTTIEQEPPDRRAYLVKGMMEAPGFQPAAPEERRRELHQHKSHRGDSEAACREDGGQGCLGADQVRDGPVPAVRHPPAGADLRPVESAVRRPGDGVDGPARTGQPPGGMQVNVETMPEFQQQWLSISSQMDLQYEQHLEDFRKQLMELV